MNRLLFIDYAKSLGIFIVVLGHFTWYLGLPFENNTVWNICYWVTLFHMPLFFIVSGILFRQKTNREQWDGCKKQIIVPYIIISVVCLVLGILIDCCKGESYGLGFIARNILAILTGNDFFGKQLNPYSDPLWYCFALLIMKLALNIVYKDKYKNAMLVFVLLLGYCCMYLGDRLPLRIDSALVAMIFFYIGFQFKNIWKGLQYLSTAKCGALAVISLGGGIFSRIF